MTEVVDFAQARVRLGARVEARLAPKRVEHEARRAAFTRELEERAAAERRRWLADLATWPQAFRAALKERVDFGTAPGILAGDRPEPGWNRTGGPAWWKAARVAAAADVIVSDYWSARRMIEEQRSEIRRAAAKLRDARARRARGPVVSLWRNRLRVAKANLLGVLWSFGLRRVPRGNGKGARA